MQQAFILPHPKSNYRMDVDENTFDVVAENRLWQQTLDRLYDKKQDRDLIFQKVLKSSHPALRLKTSRDNQTLLHLAVLFNQLEWVKSLVLLSPHLKYKSNAFGLTPYELSLFLPRTEISQFLHPSINRSFGSQPHVSIPSCEKNSVFQEIELLSQPLFQNEEVLEEILTQSKKAKSEDAIPSERIWMGIYFDEEIQKGTHPKVSIQYIDDQVKFGVFAEKRIPPCAFVGEYTGVIQERKKKELKDKVYSVRYAVWQMGGRQFIIDAEKKGNFTRFINHSAKPNLGLHSVYWRGMPRMIFVALKEIPEGSQLTFDYGALFWKEQRQKPLLFD